MIEISPICIIKGETFSPALAEMKTGLRFFKKNEPGELGKLGRFKNAPQPYGSAELVPLDDSKGYAAMNALLETLSKGIAILRECGALDISFYIAVSYQDQANLEFNTSFLAKIAELKIPLLITVFEK
ncbi:MAG TPA: hypothetical protein VN887_10305 [Candidatus Angelobacter sp.]|nr:hypothetical protein [Candidatus Angelobacter sp.]